MSLRIAIAGAGQMGRAHAQRVVKHGACTLVAFADPRSTARHTADGFGVPLFVDLLLMLQGMVIDGVILATPNGQHVQGALLCLSAGVPVLVEKPIADTLDQALALVTATRRTPVPLLVGHHRRHSAHMAAAVAAVRSGRLGRLVAVNGSATFVKPPSYFSDGPWRTQAGGGPILINLVHDIDNLRALMGEITAVQALVSNAVRGHAVEDTVAVNLRFESGALGTFLLSDTAAHPRSWEQTSAEDRAFDHHAEQDCYVVCGTQGSLQVPSLREYGYAGEGSWWQPLLLQPGTPARSAVDPLTQQLTHFCDVIEGRASPLVSADEAFCSLRATLAVAQAAASGAVVQLPKVCPVPPVEVQSAYV
jgi:predicted dehydrogenase